MKKLLIIDDNDTDLQSMAALLAETYAISTCTSNIEAARLLDIEKFDFIILDLSKKPESSIVSIISSIHGLSSSTPLLCIGAAIQASIIVLAIKAGAHDFMEKPFTANNLKAKLLLAAYPTDLREKATDYNYNAHKIPAIIGSSTIISTICETIRLFAKHDASVLILGESGTGKELAASEIHRHSKRSDKSFVPVDCASIPEHLAESYLFGTEFGAYTGSTRRKGFFEAAESGSLFLDELGVLALPIQAKLLRVLETRTGSRMGSLHLHNYDVRLISATNAANLNDSGQFRRDLLQRINTLVLEMPPLRAHLEDIPEIAIFFLAKFDSRKVISGPAMQKLHEWHWPGNVRELKNVIEKAVVFSDARDTILDSDIHTDTTPRWGVMQQSLHL